MGRFRASFAALALAAAGCATVHARPADDLPVALSDLRSIALLPSTVSASTLYVGTDHVAHGPEAAVRIRERLERALARQLDRRGFVIEAARPSPALAAALEAEILRTIARDPEFRAPAVRGALDLADDPAARAELDAAPAEAVALLAGETVSETRRGRWNRLLWNYGLGLVQVPAQVVLTIFAPAVPVSIPTIQLYEPSPSRIWLQWIVVRRSDGRVLYMADLFDTNSLLLEGEAADAVEALLEAFPTQSGAEP